MAMVKITEINGKNHRIKLISKLLFFNNFAAS